MEKKEFILGLDGIIVRLFALCFILISSVTIEKINVYLISTYILTTVILTFIQELSEKKKTRIIFYILNWITAVGFFQINRECALIFLMVLGIEFFIDKRYGIVVIISLIFIITLMELGNAYSLFYILIGLNSAYILKSSRTYREKLSRVMKDYDTLREKFYKNIKKHDNYVDKTNQNITMAKLEERNEIGRQMHDKVGHIIAGSLMRLEASKIVMKTDVDKTEEMLNEVIENLRDGMNDIRGIIHKITPTSDEFGINKVKNILSKKVLNTGIDVYFTTSGDLERIEYEMWYNIENIITELSTNSLKYAKCTKIEVDVTILNKVLRIRFKDNGVGNESFSKGFGLSKIEEEIIKNKGVMTINSSLGFEVIIILEI